MLRGAILTLCRQALQAVAWTLKLRLLVILLVLICLFGGSGALEKLGIPFILVILYAIGTGIALFATWGATKLFDVDFFVTYQIMSFGQCLCTSSKKDD